MLPAARPNRWKSLKKKFVKRQKDEIKEIVSSNNLIFNQTAPKPKTILNYGTENKFQEKGYIFSKSKGKF
ncbi:MAG: hypothetical protein R2861_09500 [Desulfobacterales bacterium]